MSEKLQKYKEYVNAPWGRLFYKAVIAQTGEAKGLDIMDFGSGFGITAEHYAKRNRVTAVEPDREITSELTYTYDLISGGIDSIKKLPDMSFDVIICHNVLEYITDKGEVLKEFARLLRRGGMISLVKHNRKGRIMQRIVLDNDTDEGAALLRGEEAYSESFGMIDYYDIDELLEDIRELRIVKRLGLRTFWGIQSNSFKNEPDWEDRMLEVELLAADDPDFAAVSFFNHIYIKKD